MSNCQESDSYRKRIYNAYVQARDEPLAPKDISGLKPRLPYLRHLVSKHFPTDRDAVILELGCGHGALLYVLNQTGYRNVKGVDGSIEQVAAAEALGIHGVSQGDFRTTLSSTPDCTVDVIVTFDVIEHFTKGELIQIVDAVHRVLKPGGEWIIHAPNSEGPFSSRIRYGDFTHEIAFTRSSLTQLLRSSGFTNIQYFEDKPIAHGLKSAVRAVLWRLIRWGLLLYIAVETGVIDRGAVFSQNLVAVAQRSD